MIDSAERSSEVRGAVTPNKQEAFGKINALLTADAVKTLAHGFGDGGRQALAGELAELPGEVVRLFILDVHAHGAIPFYQ